MPRQPWRARPALRQRAKQLRQEATDAEEMIWQRLRNRQLAGLKFRRQHPFGKFILDFYCPERRVAIELDVAAHNRQPEYDQLRQQMLEEAKIRILRLPNSLISDNIAAALRQIEAFCAVEPF